MRYLTFALVAIVALLSAVAGAAKIMAVPQEVQFFDDLGISQLLLRPFGFVQVLAALAVIFVRSRVLGAYLAAVAFFVSSLMVLMSDNLVFAALSLLPVFAAICLGRVSTPRAPG